MKKSTSYLSMENLDLGGEENGEASQESGEESPEEAKKNFKSLDPNSTNAAANELNSGASPLDQESISIDPTYILNKGFSKVTAVGSSTALVAIRNQKSISIANLGDSGFIIIRFRDGQAYAARRSNEQ